MENKLIKKLATAAVATTTVLSVLQAPGVLADNNSATAKATGEVNAKVTINKTLNIAEGITTPKATFKFTFAPVDGTSSNNAPYQKASDSDKSKGFIPERTITYSEKDVLQNGQDSIKKATGDIFEGVSYDRAGEYVYKVSETQNTYETIKDKADQAIDAIKYDTRAYDMHVIVKNKDKGEGTYISSVYFKEIKNDAEETAKKEPSSTTGEATFKYDLFENTYTKDAGKIDPQDPNPNTPSKDKTDKNQKSLTIVKKVDGGTADKTKEFTFNLTVTLPKSNATATTPVESIDVHYGDKNENVPVGQDHLTITKTFTLKHGQEFTVDNLPAGSRYSVTETGTSGYTASAVYTENGASQTAQAGTQATDYKVENVLVGEKKNDNTITNKFQDVTPTGLLIDNLPFILMIGLGLTGFVALSRKRRQG